MTCSDQTPGCNARRFFIVRDAKLSPAATQQVPERVLGLVGDVVGLIA